MSVHFNPDLGNIAGSPKAPLAPELYASSDALRLHLGKHKQEYLQYFRDACADNNFVLQAAVTLAFGQLENEYKYNLPCTISGKHLLCAEMKDCYKKIKAEAFPHIKEQSYLVDADYQNMVKSAAEMGFAEAQLVEILDSNTRPLDELKNLAEAGCKEALFYYGWESGWEKKDRSTMVNAMWKSGFISLLCAPKFMTFADFSMDFKKDNSHLNFIDISPDESLGTLFCSDGTVLCPTEGIQPDWFEDNILPKFA